MQISCKNHRYILSVMAKAFVIKKVKDNQLVLENIAFRRFICLYTKPERT